ncbi:hypothetical protein AAG570_006145 [Ranatra chinensis]|uniref:Uncharacterized protein n=1 Tax=Ranatra chinensis TaxID=642074 RepID=A0ABD0XX67_9HEMI
MASKRRNLFHENKTQEMTKTGSGARVKGADLDSDSRTKGSSREFKGSADHNRAFRATRQGTAREDARNFPSKEADGKEKEAQKKPYQPRFKIVAGRIVPVDIVNEEGTPKPQPSSSRMDGSTSAAPHPYKLGPKLDSQPARQHRNGRTPPKNGKNVPARDKKVEETQCRNKDVQDRLKRTEERKPPSNTKVDLMVATRNGGSTGVKVETISSTVNGVPPSRTDKVLIAEIECPRKEKEHEGGATVAKCSPEYEETTLKTSSSRMDGSTSVAPQPMKSGTKPLRQPASQHRNEELGPENNQHFPFEGSKGEQIQRRKKELPEGLKLIEEGSLPSYKQTHDGATKAGGIDLKEEVSNVPEPEVLARSCGGGSTAHVEYSSVNAEETALKTSSSRMDSNTSVAPQPVKSGPKLLDQPAAQHRNEELGPENNQNFTFEGSKCDKIRRRKKELPEGLKLIEEGSLPSYKQTHDGATKAGGTDLKEEVSNVPEAEVLARSCGGGSTAHVEYSSVNAETVSGSGQQASDRPSISRAAEVKKIKERNKVTGEMLKQIYERKMMAGDIQNEETTLMTYCSRQQEGKTNFPIEESESEKIRRQRKELCERIKIIEDRWLPSYEHETALMTYCSRQQEGKTNFPIEESESEKIRRQRKELFERIKIIEDRWLPSYEHNHGGTRKREDVPSKEKVSHDEESEAVAGSCGGGSIVEKSISSVNVKTHDGATKAGGTDLKEEVSNVPEPEVLARSCGGGSTAHVEYSSVNAETVSGSGQQASDRPSISRAAEVKKIKERNKVTGEMLKQIYERKMMAGDIQNEETTLMTYCSRQQEGKTNFPIEESESEKIRRQRKELCERIKIIEDRWLPSYEHETALMTYCSRQQEGKTNFPIEESESEKIRRQRKELFERIKIIEDRWLPSYEHNHGGTRKREDVPSKEKVSHDEESEAVAGSCGGGSIVEKSISSVNVKTHDGATKAGGTDLKEEVSNVPEPEVLARSCGGGSTAHVEYSSVNAETVSGSGQQASDRPSISRAAEVKKIKERNKVTGEMLKQIYERKMMAGDIQNEETTLMTYCSRQQEGKTNFPIEESESEKIRRQRKELCERIKIIEDRWLPSYEHETALMTYCSRQQEGKTNFPIEESESEKIRRQRKELFERIKIIEDRWLPSYEHNHGGTRKREDVPSKEKVSHDEESEAVAGSCGGGSIVEKSISSVNVKTHDGATKAGGTDLKEEVSNVPEPEVLARSCGGGSTAHVEYSSVNAETVSGSGQQASDRPSISRAAEVKKIKERNKVTGEMLKQIYERKMMAGDIQNEETALMTYCSRQQEGKTNFPIEESESEKIRRQRKELCERIKIIEDRWLPSYEHETALMTYCSRQQEGKTNFPIEESESEKIRRQRKELFERIKIIEDRWLPSYEHETALMTYCSRQQEGKTNFPIEESESEKIRRQRKELFERIKIIEDRWLQSYEHNHGGTRKREDVPSKEKVSHDEESEAVAGSCGGGSIVEKSISSVNVKTHDGATKAGGTDLKEEVSNVPEPEVLARSCGGGSTAHVEYSSVNAETVSGSGQQASDRPSISRAAEVKKIKERNKVTGEMLKQIYERKMMAGDIQNEETTLMTYCSRQQEGKTNFPIEESESEKIRRQRKELCERIKIIEDRWLPSYEHETALMTYCSRQQEGKTNFPIEESESEKIRRQRKELFERIKIIEDRWLPSYEHETALMTYCSRQQEGKTNFPIEESESEKIRRQRKELFERIKIIEDRWLPSYEHETALMTYCSRQQEGKTNFPIEESESEKIRRQRKELFERIKIIEDRWLQSYEHNHGGTRKREDVPSKEKVSHDEESEAVAGSCGGGSIVEKSISSVNVKTHDGATKAGGTDLKEEVSNVPEPEVLARSCGGGSTAHVEYSSVNAETVSGSGQQASDRPSISRAAEVKKIKERNKVTGEMLKQIYERKMMAGDIQNEETALMTYCSRQQEGKTNFPIEESESEKIRRQRKELFERIKIIEDRWLPSYEHETALMTYCSRQQEGKTNFPIEESESEKIRRQRKELCERIKIIEDRWLPSYEHETALMTYCSRQQEGKTNFPIEESESEKIRRQRKELCERIKIIEDRWLPSYEHETALMTYCSRQQEGKTNFPIEESESEKIRRQRKELCERIKIIEDRWLPSYEHETALMTYCSRQQEGKTNFPIEESESEKIRRQRKELCERIKIIEDRWLPSYEHETALMTYCSRQQEGKTNFPIEESESEKIRRQRKELFERIKIIEDRWLPSYEHETALMTYCSRQQEGKTNFPIEESESEKIRRQRKELFERIKIIEDRWLPSYEHETALMTYCSRQQEGKTNFPIEESESEKIRRQRKELCERIKIIEDRWLPSYEHETALMTYCSRQQEGKTNFPIEESESEKIRRQRKELCERIKIIEDRWLPSYEHETALMTYCSRQQEGKTNFPIEESESEKIRRQRKELCERIKIIEDRWLPSYEHETALMTYCSRQQEGKTNFPIEESESEKIRRQRKELCERIKIIEDRWLPSYEHETALMTYCSRQQEGKTNFPIEESESEKIRRQRKELCERIKIIEDRWLPSYEHNHGGTRKREDVPSKEKVSHDEESEAVAGSCGGGSIVEKSISSVNVKTHDGATKAGGTDLKEEVSNVPEPEVLARSCGGGSTAHVEYSSVNAETVSGSGQQASDRPSISRAAEVKKIKERNKVTGEMLKQIYERKMMAGDIQNEETALMTYCSRQQEGKTNFPIEESESEKIRRQRKELCERIKIIEDRWLPSYEHETALMTYCSRQQEGKTNFPIEESESEKIRRQRKELCERIKIIEDRWLPSYEHETALMTYCSRQQEGKTNFPIEESESEKIRRQRKELCERIKIIEDRWLPSYEHETALMTYCSRQQEGKTNFPIEESESEKIRRQRKELCERIKIIEDRWLPSYEHETALMTYCSRQQEGKTNFPIEESESEKIRRQRKELCERIKIIEDRWLPSYEHNHGGTRKREDVPSKEKVSHDEESEAVAGSCGGGSIVEKSISSVNVKTHDGATKAGGTDLKEEVSNVPEPEVLARSCGGGSTAHVEYSSVNAETVSGSGQQASDRPSISRAAEVKKIKERNKVTGEMLKQIYERKMMAGDIQNEETALMTYCSRQQEGKTNFPIEESESEKIRRQRKELCERIKIIEDRWLPSYEHETALMTYCSRQQEGKTNFPIEESESEKIRRQRKELCERIKIIEDRWLPSYEHETALMTYCSRQQEGKTNFPIEESESEKIRRQRKELCERIKIIEDRWLPSYEHETALMTYCSRQQEGKTNFPIEESESEKIRRQRKELCERIKIIEDRWLPSYEHNHGGTRKREDVPSKEKVSHDEESEAVAGSCGGGSIVEKSISSVNVKTHDGATKAGGTDLKEEVSNVPEPEVLARSCGGGSTAHVEYSSVNAETVSGSGQQASDRPSISRAAEVKKIKERNKVTGEMLKQIYERKMMAGDIQNEETTLMTYCSRQQEGKTNFPIEESESEKIRRQRKELCERIKIIEDRWLPSYEHETALMTYCSRQQEGKTNFPIEESESEKIRRQRKELCERIKIIEDRWLPSYEHETALMTYCSRQQEGKTNFPIEESESEKIRRQRKELCERIKIIEDRWLPSYEHETALMTYCSRQQEGKTNFPIEESESEKIRRQRKELCERIKIIEDRWLPSYEHETALMTYCSRQQEGKTNFPIEESESEKIRRQRKELCERIKIIEDRWLPSYEHGVPVADRQWIPRSTDSLSDVEDTVDHHPSSRVMKPKTVCKKPKKIVAKNIKEELKGGRNKTAKFPNKNTRSEVTKAKKMGIPREIAEQYHDLVGKPTSRRMY